MERLTVNECALILCILGIPDPMDKTRRILPAVEEALSYMMGVTDQVFPVVNKEPVVRPVVQLELFA